ncbi:uncharacterized protein [Periplaneta americana]|uniref:uncharacterized protein n=1 Tax=Periplaneta americana TaxID=6978 RepID=UPI0037E77421
MKPCASSKRTSLRFAGAINHIYHDITQITASGIMDKASSKLSSKSKSTDSLKDRILYRLKMVKNSSKPSITGTQQQCNEYPSCSSGQQYQDHSSDDWQRRKISPEGLQQICEQLGKFLRLVRNIQDLTYRTYDYPSVLLHRLEKDANELECLFLEMRAAVNNIKRLKQQKKAITNEKSLVKKALKKLHDEEIEEMESIISTYDKSMFTNWQKVKNTRKPKSLEIFLNEVKRKHEAMEHLNTLASRKLNQLMASTETAAEANTSRAQQTSPPSTVITSGTDSSPPDRPRREPRFMRVTSSSIRRRRHYDRHDNGNVDLPMIPFTASVWPGGTSNHDLNGTDSSNTDVVSEFQSEMTAVMHALLGDLSRTSLTSITFNTDQDNNGNTNRDIELHSISRPTE